MAKKGQTAKHRRQRKKEKANRKERKQQLVAQQVEERIVADRAEPEKVGKMIPHETDVKTILEEDKPMSPARRAFQDI